MRKLASIQRIADLQPIPDADAIEVASVQGWKVVVKKGEFQVGDLCCYLEIDSWVPHAIAPFLSKGKEPREYEGVPGERLRTVKLRGQISQGLVLPIGPGGIDYYGPTDEGTDLTLLLDIKKWERPIPAQLHGQVRGNFPAFIPKTDQERCQNLVRQVAQAHAAGDLFEVSVKLDGTSFTAYHNDGATGFCSRNLELKPEDSFSVYAHIYHKHNLGEVLKKHGRNLAIQGEIMGPGIQGNRENLSTHLLFLFDIYDIDAGAYLTPDERVYFWRHHLLQHGIEHVPILNPEARMPATVDELLAKAEGPSLFNPVREGLVWKRHDGQFSLKAISNRFLLSDKH
jgi:RNA ligase (TIGR02306 family)